MGIKALIDVANEMLAEGVIDRFAIAGAVGATFYLEPISARSVDILVTVRPAPGSLTIDPHPIFDYVTTRGGKIVGEHVVLEDWPLQFLPPTGPLAEEALAQAVESDVAGTPMRVLTAEHLAAIALQTARAADRALLLHFIEAEALDFARFRAILARHALVDAWRKFERLFLDGVA